MVIIGLTGSIGMGKSTTAGFFKEFGCPVHDADAVVHAIYQNPPSALGGSFPEAIEDGVINRERLAALVLHNPQKLQQLEALVHPLVWEAEAAFLHKAAWKKQVVLDIPLLFETGADRRCHVIVVATAPFDQQRARVLARPGMTEERFQAIVSKQMPDAEKRKRAHFRVDTSHGFESAKAQVHDILRALAGCC